MSDYQIHLLLFRHYHFKQTFKTRESFHNYEILLFILFQQIMHCRMEIQNSMEVCVPRFIYWLLFYTFSIIFYNYKV